MSRLSMEIDPEQHRQIKTLATFAGPSIKDYILAKTLPAKAPPAAADTTQTLLGNPKNAARPRKALAAPRSEYIRFASLQELEDALGIETAGV